MSNRSSSRFLDRLLSTGGEAGRVLAQRDWGTSTLCHPDTWPAPLRSVVELMLGSKFPMFVAWGKELGFIYNDAYAEILGDKHPYAMGARFEEIWREIWSDILPLIEAALSGKGTYQEDLPLFMNRRGYDEKAWFTFSYSPIHDENGEVVGMFCAVAETTAKVLAERRQNFVVDLSDTLSQLVDPVEVTAAAAKRLGEHLKVGRAGYGEISDTGDVVRVARDWTDGSMASLAGEARVLDAFGPEIISELRRGRTLTVEDCQTDVRTSSLDYLSTWDSIGVRSLIVAPLLDDERLVAILYVHSDVPRAWSDLDVRLVQDVGSRTWSAVERLHTEGALRASEAALADEVEALERLQGISTQLVGDETPETIYGAILKAAADLMGSECASIQMLDTVGVLQLLAHHGYDPRSAKYWQTVNASSGSTCGIALTTGQRVVVPDVEASGLPDDSGDLKSYRWSGMRAVQTTPLLSRSGKPLGMLSTHWKHPCTPAPRDLKLFDVLARQAADAIERAMTQSELRESEARQAFLLSLSDALRSLKSPNAIASEAARRLGERFNLSRVFYAEFFGSVMKVEQDFTDGVESIVGEHDLEAFGPDLLRAYHERQIVKVDDVRRDSRFSETARAGLLARQVGAYLDVILYQDDRWVSVLALQSAAARVWTASEEGLFREVGERVKAAIDRIRGEDRLRELNDTLEHRVVEAMAERNLLARLVEMTDVMIMAVDLDYKILALNSANADDFERVYGVRPKPGDNMLDLLADQPEQQEQVRAGWGRGMQGEPVTFVEDFGDPDRARPYYEVTFRPLLNESGAQVGVYQFATDITERLRKEAQLAEAQDALRQSQKMEAMGQLTGGVAHDFNNLLTPIVGSLDLLQRGGLGGEREQRLIEGAIQSAERARVLVQRLLAFARRQPLQPVPVDLSRLVAEMGELIASTTGPQIRVLVEAAANLPPAKADPNQLEMALLNLAVNARDAMEDKGGTLRISTMVETVAAGHRAKLYPGAYLCLSVADTGSGMDEQTIARAIEPFFSTKGVGKGTGLGLSMVHGLASQLGGALTIQSRPGYGTNIELWLPVSEAGLAQEESGTALARLPGMRGTAMLVDDEELVRMSTADMLTDLGYAVLEAASGEEALRRIMAGEDLDLLVTDHMMPGMTGTDLARQVRGLHPQLPVLLVSGYAEREGVDPDLPRLTKPFRRDELAATLAPLEMSRAKTG